MSDEITFEKYMGLVSRKKKHHFELLFLAAVGHWNKYIELEQLLGIIV